MNTHQIHDLAILHELYISHSLERDTITWEYDSLLKFITVKEVDLLVIAECDQCSLPLLLSFIIKGMATRVTFYWAHWWVLEWDVLHQRWFFIELKFLLTEIVVRETFYQLDWFLIVHNKQVIFTRKLNNLRNNIRCDFNLVSVINGRRQLLHQSSKFWIVWIFWTDHILVNGRTF